LTPTGNDHQTQLMPIQNWLGRSTHSAAFAAENFCLRALTVVDNRTRERVEIEVGQGVKGDDVVGTL
jgi:hypothetical protein